MSPFLIMKKKALIPVILAASILVETQDSNTNCYSKYKPLDEPTVLQEQKRDIGSDWDQDAIKLASRHICEYLKQDVEFTDFVPYQGRNNFANDWTVFTKSNGVAEVKVRFNGDTEEIEVFFTNNFLKF